ncbi:MAG: hypothetical protein LKE31_01395 [Bacilli bacterium]|jgi:hypothetical protein|nr:hypothetical protein [Bacilli bacterium]MCH4278061.1 hypothetical protein [Bacilli bacterium]
MFDQKEYINEYVKKNYRTIKIRVRNDDAFLLKRLGEVDDMNRYVKDLIAKDALAHGHFHYINEDAPVDFELSKTMSDLVEKAEKADYIDDYGLYMNLVDAIDSQGKKEVGYHTLSETEWKKLTRRYCL